MNARSDPVQIIDLSIPGAVARWNVSDFTTLSLQVVPHTGAINTGRLTVEESIGGDVFVGLPSPLVISTTGIETFMVEDVAFVQLRVTTTEAVKVKVYGYMHDYEGGA